MTCPVCYDNYTSHLRKAVQCNYCNYSACSVCYKRYLLESLQDAHCMNCRRSWNDEFVDLNFTRAFRIGPWRKHREEILFQRELALLPTRQPRVEARHKLDALYIEYEKNDQELYEWNKKFELLNKEKEEIKKKRQKIEKLETRYAYESRGEIPPTYTLEEDERDGNYRKENMKERSKFIMKCPDAECRGFLSTAYKCAVCQLYACKDCLELVGKISVTDLPENTHTCSEERKASVALILKDSKPCPKCGERISKISGCNQMFCVDCHTAFSWDTGKIITGVIHNPHYHEYLQKQASGVVPQNVGEIHCGGIPDYYFIYHKVREFPHFYTEQYAAIHQTISELSDVHIYQYPNAEFDAETNGDLGTKYLLKEIDQEEFKKELIQRETSVIKKRSIRPVLDMFLNTSIMMLNAITNTQEFTFEQMQNYLQEFNTLRMYVNESLIRIGQMKGCNVPQIATHNGNYNLWYWMRSCKPPPIRPRERKQKEKKTSSGDMTEINNGGSNCVNDLESNDSESEVIEVED